MQLDTERDELENRMTDNGPNPAGPQVSPVSTETMEASHGSHSGKTIVSLCDASLTINVSTESASRPAYFDYSPMAPPHEGKGVCYRTCLDRLGMKQDAMNARIQFVQDVKEHTQEPECLFLRKEDNAPAFVELISGFLRKRGSYYWGTGNRDHLMEQDISKGFLYPRDAERPNSRWAPLSYVIFTYSLILNLSSL